MIRAAVIALALATALPAGAQDRVAPRLGAASNFGQSWDAEMLESAQALGVTDLRDAVYWNDVEREGVDRFDTFRSTYPALLPPRGMGMSATVNNGHAEYDGGVTPHTAEAVAGFADFAARLVTEYPAIDAVEVGNEMNSATFTSGPMREADLAGKARYYTALLAATGAAVGAARPEVRILGGAAHSIPIAWFEALSEAGAPEHMDAVVVHPYTTPPEQFGRQVALLRAVPGFAQMPIEVTEFGDEDAETAPATLVKYYCQMALHGVTRVVWYPLNPRGDGLVPLIDGENGVTPVGRAYALLDTHAAGREVRDASPDAFTYGCAFGTEMLVLWGAPRGVEVEAGLRVLDPDGDETDRRALSRETPLVILGDGAVVALGDTVRLGPQRVIADSFDQFTYGPSAPGTFQPVAVIRGEESAFALRGGQQTNGVPWTPYLGHPSDGLLRMNAEFLLPSGGGENAAVIVQRYTAPEDLRAQLLVTLEPSPRSADGIEAWAEINGREIGRTTLTERGEFVLEDLMLTKGARLDVAVAPGASADGDTTLYRVTLLRAP
jgi:hypothetical protein